MLFRLLKTIFSRPTSSISKQLEQLNALERGNQLNQEGDVRSAILEFRKHLQLFPHDLWALNNLGCCLSDIGDNDGAAKCFELAFSLDDSFLPVVINHAKFLSDHQRTDEAMGFLRQAKISDPDFPNVDAVFGGAALTKGDPELARQHTLRAWLASFDNLRFANCYLFYCAYADIDEAQLAAEHRFWGETVTPITHTKTSDEQEIADTWSLPQNNKKKIRLAYWSPDFRNHSVRYFFRPLLENHDREKFEIVLYHDFPISDAQTENIKAHADYFFPVSDLPDHKLLKLIQSHKLDILVELAGHSSTNRLKLLQERLATAQITGIGYPPTTGLRNVDAKLIDSHIVTPDSPCYYTEAPLILPSSFWCFDPKEEADIEEKPPSLRNGYITFACVGNIAKINMRIITCWAKILQRVPKSRLLLRSISFNDKTAQEHIRQELEKAGIALERVDILGPSAGRAYFESYNDIDIVLDTYPFNGGTTTCFATYMGVPVVSWAGKSVISRMGQSILENLQLSDWVVKDADSYIERAVKAANELDFLQQLRTDVRKRFNTSPLGNGALFAREFESACTTLLETMQKGTFIKHSRVDALPEQEILLRAYAVLRSGQNAAAKRIIDHCLDIYPNSGSAHILSTQELTTRGLFQEATNYLEERLTKFTSSEQVAALINIARNHLQADRENDAANAIRRAQSIASNDPFDAIQIAALSAAIHARTAPTQNHFLLQQYPAPLKIDIMLVCDDDSFFLSTRDRITSHCQKPENLFLNFIQCSEIRKKRSYASVLEHSAADIFICLQKNIEIHNPLFFQEIVNTLEHFDMIGIAGAKNWDRMDWRLSNSSNKAASFIIPSSEKVGHFELQIKGNHQQSLVSNIAVLDGSLLVFHRRTLALTGKPDLDQLLEGGAALMEEDFSYQAAKAGARLAVHQNLGVVMDWQTPLQNEHLGEARWHLAQKMEFDPFAPLKDDRTIVSVPIRSPEEGLSVQNHLFGKTK